MTSKELIRHYGREAQKNVIRSLVTDGKESRKYDTDALELQRRVQDLRGMVYEAAELKIRK